MEKGGEETGRYWDGHSNCTLIGGGNSIEAVRGVDHQNSWHTRIAVDYRGLMQIEAACTINLFVSEYK